jgi:hydroxyacylglutathione hydrolase
MIIEKIEVGDFATNCYLLACKKSKKTVIIDPGADTEKINSAIQKNSLAPDIIINTHGHIDHIKEDDKFNLPVYIHYKDKHCFKDPGRNLSSLFGIPLTFDITPEVIKGEQTIIVGELTLKFIHTPGHSPGSITIQADNVLFTGDTLFASGRGRTDLPYAEEEKLFDSIKNKLLVFPESTVIYPGHGPVSTIGNEKIFYR